MQLGVLVELAWGVLRPMRSVLPRRTILLISLAILGAGAAFWPLTTFTVNHSWPGIGLPFCASNRHFHF